VPPVLTAGFDDASITLVEVQNYCTYALADNTQVNSAMSLLPLVDNPFTSLQCKEDTYGYKMQIEDDYDTTVLFNST
jgi:hypothetical protein